RGLFARELRRQIEPIVVVLLLPMFFAYSGLKTHLDVIHGGDMYLITIVILAIACLGKAIPCWAAGRLTGEDNRTSIAIGTLMHARGMMELILLNIGLQRGVIQAPLFSVMVIMAIATTMMASPLFEWFYGAHARRAGSFGVIRP